MNVVGIVALAAAVALLLTGADSCDTTGRRSSPACQRADQAAQQDANDPAKQQQRQEECR